MIEKYAGKFPVWLAPVQVKVIPIAQRHNEAAQKVLVELQKAGIRVELDDRQERMQAKVRDGSLQKIPFMAIIGDKEAALAPPSVAVRGREGENFGLLTLGAFLEKLKTDIETKR
ncbi:MAG: Threonine-tRNA ligase [Candidatus Gottesmanbacteria bacterium GW2011_GWA1_42_26]|nr:MAG: Threonine-tRNA ligase [Candidatus Gottesmanbacteria bacterium GW2011_GWA1_42_26]